MHICVEGRDDEVGGYSRQDRRVVTTYACSEMSFAICHEYALYRRDEKRRVQYNR